MLYYRDPALSLLWPFMEFSPDHLAVRPVYSVYGRESETPVYNVVWPIAQFNTENGNCRVFPVYWGDDYFHVFPIYWHKGDPLAGGYAGEDSGSWVFPLHRHKTEADGDVNGRYLGLGSSSKTEDESRHAFWGIYRFRDWEQPFSWKNDSEYAKKRHWNYLFLGKSHDDRVFEKQTTGSPDLFVRHRIEKGFFPLWSRKKEENIVREKSEETSSLLLALYDSRAEQQKGHSYIRRRVLWRLWHYERLNGDSSTDVFPGITVDNYKNGYFKCSFLWRFFRYENDPESGKKELGLLFISLRW